jgi:hypothetical protein
MNDFQHPIDVLAEDIRLRTNEAEEWETTSDPHAVNKPRAELLRRQIAQDEEAIDILRAKLNGHEKAQNTQNKGDKHE